MFLEDMRRHWWLNRDDVSQSIFSIVEYLDEHQTRPREANLHHLRLYSNRLASGLSSRSYSVSDNGERLRLNVIRSVIDAAVAHIATNRPRPEYLTIDGDFSMRRQADSLNKFINGQFYATDQYAKSLDIFRDACIFGTGIEKIYHDKGEIKTERIFPNEILVDEQESMMGDPRCIYQHKEVVRGVAAKVWPRAKSFVESADLIRSDDSYSPDTLADMISVVEAWHLPSYPGAGDGRHVVCISNKVLIDEKYERDSFPFSFFRWQKAPLGFWGSGIAEELSSIQIEINYIARKIQEHFTASAGQVWMKKGSGIAKGSFTNQVGAINTYRDVPPQMLTPNPVSPMFNQYLDSLYRRAFQQVGLSEMSATSLKPAGLNSGEALRTYNDIGSKRFQHVAQNWERFHLSIAEQMNQTARDITESGGGSLRVLAAGEKAIEEIDFSDISIEKDKYTMQCAPVSYLAGTPAGKFAALRDLAQFAPEAAQGLIHYLKIPDLEKTAALINAPLNLAEKYIERILVKGEYEAPDPIMDLDLARKVASVSLMEAKNDGTPLDRVELLRRWIEAIDELQSMAEAPPPPMPGQPPIEPLPAESAPPSPAMPPGPIPELVN
jgi:hypothetical protein